MDLLVLGFRECDGTEAKLSDCALQTPKSGASRSLNPNAFSLLMKDQERNLVLIPWIYRTCLSDAAGNPIRPVPECYRDPSETAGCNSGCSHHVTTQAKQSVVSPVIPAVVLRDCF